jgi:hypothetical protein
MRYQRIERMRRTQRKGLEAFGETKLRGQNHFFMALTPLDFV